MKPEVFMPCMILFLFMVCIGTAFYFYYREQKIFRALQKMLDDAIAGNFQDKRLDETGVSAIENSMWRYLCGREMSYQKLKEQKEQIQSLISDISHQAVTPVCNIILYSQLLEEAQAESAGQDMQGMELSLEEIRAIRDQAKKLDFFIQSLVKLSRMENGMIAVNAKCQDIREMLLSIKQQFLPKAEQKGIYLEVMDASGLAVFDRKWTAEAVGNLVDNAIKYTPSGGTVSVKIEKYAMFLRINIIDTGIGIREEEQGNIFTRFYRCAEVSEKPGLGLGLYLAREVISVQNGYIKVTSELGKGSVFSVFLRTA